MYDELIKSLRVCASSGLPDSCLECPRFENGCDTLREDAADAIQELSRLHEAQRQNLITLMNEDPEIEWIPVTERLPDESEPVLAYVCWPDYTDNEICYGQYIKNGRFRLTHYVEGELIKGYEVKAWMPLPEPPKEE